MDEFSTDSFNPFDRFLKRPDVAMLNSALPYVGEDLRKPLALYIKILEMNRILTDFDNEDVLSACGFEESRPNPEAMLKAMKAAGGKDASPQIDSLLNMLNLIRTYQSYMELIQKNPELSSFINNMVNSKQGPSQDSSPTKENIDLMNILSELLKNQ
ncbi:MAG: hypothetical protein Q4B70_05775 [Lachnospiraceae bacterium]|nr:hypothetical protein [Lachnospiraceae bacterium]